MKYLRLVSDLHLDFDIDLFNMSKLSLEQKKSGDMSFLWLPPQLDEDSDTVLVIAGDIWTSRKFLTRQYRDGQSWLKKVSSQFKYVIFTLGNHDYWGANLSDEPSKIRKELALQNLFNVFLMENDNIILDGHKFIGSTLWTDFNRHDLGLLMAAPGLMKDYKKIRFGSAYKKLSPSNLYDIFNISSRFIFNNASKDHSSQKIIIITHMAPSDKSLAPRYKNNPRPINYLYFSDLEEKIMTSSIDLWLHGHTHDICDYMIGKTRVLANQRGYSDEIVSGFDPEFRIELN